MRAHRSPLTRCVERSTVPKRGTIRPPVSMEETMSSTASIITVFASAAFALIVVAVVVRVAPKTH